MSTAARPISNQTQTQSQAQLHPNSKRSNWRIVGRADHDQPSYLICFGQSECDLMRRLRRLFTKKTLDELNAIESIWIERWTRETPWHPAEWIAIEEIPLCSYRLRAAALKQSAMNTPPTNRRANQSNSDDDSTANPTSTKKSKHKHRPKKRKGKRRHGRSILAIHRPKPEPLFHQLMFDWAN